MKRKMSVDNNFLPRVLLGDMCVYNLRVKEDGIRNKMKPRVQMPSVFKQSTLWVVSVKWGWNNSNKDMLWIWREAMYPKRLAQGHH